MVMTFACPVHACALLQGADSLVCPQGEIFAIRDGIPRFVDGSTYADAFGAQWKRYRLTQLDSYSRAPITRDRVRRCLGQDLWRNLAGKRVLECGCGAGRFTEVLLDRGACVISVDLSDAVEANLQNFPETARHQVAQADILRLPFQRSQFDIVFCLGVIQHTPKPERTIAALFEHVKPGGALVIDHYTYSLSELTKSAMVFRQILKRFPKDSGLRWTESIVRALLPLHKRARGSRLAQMFLSRLSPVLCYYRAYPELNDDMQYQWALLDTHDSLTCWYRHLRTRSQIQSTLESLGLEEIVCGYNGNGVEARAWRPVKGESPSKGRKSVSP